MAALFLDGVGNILTYPILFITNVLRLYSQSGERHIRVRLVFAYTQSMLSPLEVLDILAKRLDERANVLERVSLCGYDTTVYELRRFAAMIRKARAYLADAPSAPD